MRPGLKRLRYLGEAALFWLLLPLVLLLGPDRASALFGRLGRGIGPRLGGNAALRRRVALAMPERSAADIDAILAGMWENLCRTLAELAFLPRFAQPPWSGRIALQGEEHFRRAMASGRGVFLLTGHFGNWEMMLPALSRLAAGRGMVGVYRPLNNPFLDGHLFRLRQRAMRASLLSGLPDRLIPKTGDQRGNIRAILRALHRREGVVMLVDQKANQGVEARLFGLPAMTTHLPARLAIEGGHAVLPFCVVRAEGVRFALRFFEPIPVPPPPAGDEAVAALTQRINDFLEECIRARPQQWLWLHNRWFANEKNRPR